MSAAPLHLACAATPDHLPHAAAMLHSAAAHCPPGGLHAHLLHPEGAPPRDLDRVREMVKRTGGVLTCRPVADAALAGLPRNERIPALMWAPLLLEELLPGVDRVIFLDTDTIVLDDLGPLWGQELGGHAVGAVPNVIVEPEHTAHLARLGVAPMDYLNTGVLLLDLERARSDELARRVLAVGRDRAAELLFPEQDALSVVLDGRWQRLHPRWNAMNSVVDFPQALQTFGPGPVAEARARPAIRHFEGPGLNKPWNYRCVRPQRAFYDRHRRETPWPRYRPEGRTPRAVAGRLRRRLHAGVRRRA